MNLFEIMLIHGTPAYPDGTRILVTDASANRAITAGFADTKVRKPNARVGSIDPSNRHELYLGPIAISASLLVLPEKEVGPQ